MCGGRNAEVLDEDFGRRLRAATCEVRRFWGAIFAADIGGDALLVGGVLDGAQGIADAGVCYGYGVVLDEREHRIVRSRPLGRGTESLTELADGGHDLVVLVLEVAAAASASLY